MYLTVDNLEFIESIKIEKKIWIQGKQSKGYSFRDLIQTATATYNDLIAANEWMNNQKHVKKEKDPKFIALSAQFEELKRSVGETGDSNKNQNDNQNEGWKKS